MQLRTDRHSEGFLRLVCVLVYEVFVATGVRTNRRVRETCNVVSRVLLIHLYGAHKRKRFSDSHRNLHVTHSAYTSIDDTEDEVLGSVLRFSNNFNEAKNCRQIAVEGVLIRQKEGMQQQ